MFSLNTGDTGFVMLCTALVCMMTPALALFYGGMVRKKNVLTIMMQNFISMGVTAVIWIFGGFSLAFGPDVGGLFGDISYHFALDKVGIAPSPIYASTVPFILFFAYQLMFAVIAPALITGAFAGRLNFRGYLKFLILWMIFIYIPVCHWIWGGGFLAKIGVMDFAGGIVIHVSAGFAALASVIFLGRRDDIKPGEPTVPNNLPLVAVGAGLLWFGWFGFNAGGAYAADGLAAYAFTNTTIAGSIAMIVWMLYDWHYDRKPASPPLPPAPGTWNRGLQSSSEPWVLPCATTPSMYKNASDSTMRLKCGVPTAWAASPAPCSSVFSPAAVSIR